MPAGLLSLLTFVSVVLMVAGVYSLLTDLFLRDRARVQERIDEQFRGKQRERAKRSLLVKDIEAIGNDLPEGARALQAGLRQRMQSMLEQSGLELTLPMLLAICGGSSIVAGLIGFALQRSVVIALFIAAVGLVGPLGYVHWKRNARIEALRRQLSDAFDLMARILRAGKTMAQAMQGVADEFAAPIADEFAFCSEQQNLGLAPEISLRGLARRTGLIELNIFVVAVLVQRQVGGNLSEILENLAKIVRERYRIRGVIRSLTAEGRLQAVVLMSLPPLLFMVMLIANRDYAVVLLQRPSLLAGMVFFQGLGALWIRKIVNFDF